MSQRQTAVDQWRGFSLYVGMVMPAVDKFLSMLQAFDEKKVFGPSPFKESGGLPPEYCMQFLDWCCSPLEKKTASTVSQKMKDIKKLYHIRQHVFCPDNTFIHPSQRMLRVNNIKQWLWWVGFHE